MTTKTVEKPSELSVLIGAGSVLTHWVLRLDDRELVQAGSLDLGATIQYAWPHPSNGLWYVSCSDGGGRSGPAPGSNHYLTPVRIDPHDGSIHAEREQRMLPSRAIHVTVDPSGEHVLAAFNQPAALRVYPVMTDGRLGAEIEQDSPIDAGDYPHQVRVTHDGRQVLSTALGESSARHEGQVNLFDFEQGQLRNQRIIAPHGDSGFNPRHLDPHPNGRWVYVSLEGQNQLDMFERKDDELAGEPSFTRRLLGSDPDPGVRQLAGAIHVHPAGAAVYGVNRSRDPGSPDGTMSRGEDSLVVFVLDPDTGDPRIVQRIDTRGVHCRTFQIDQTGTHVLAAHVFGAETSARIEPPGLSVFNVADDGRLTFSQRYLIDSNGAPLYWMAISSDPTPQTPATDALRLRALASMRNGFDGLDRNRDDCPI